MTLSRPHDPFSPHLTYTIQDAVGARGLPVDQVIVDDAAHLTTMKMTKLDADGQPTGDVTTVTGEMTLELTDRPAAKAPARRRTTTKTPRTRRTRKAQP